MFMFYVQILSHVTVNVILWTPVLTPFVIMYCMTPPRYKYLLCRQAIHYRLSYTSASTTSTKVRTAKPKMRFYKCCSSGYGPCKPGALMAALAPLWLHLWLAPQPVYTWQSYASLFFWLVCSSTSADFYKALSRCLPKKLTPSSPSLMAQTMAFGLLP